MHPDVELVNDTVDLVGWTPDGRSLVATDGARGLALIDPSTGTVNMRYGDLWPGRTEIGPVAVTFDR
jgi:hypothetical protein